MKKARIATIILVLAVIFLTGLTSAAAATVSSWSNIFFTKITTNGYDINGVEDEKINVFDGSVINPSTSNYHYKDTVKIYVTTGSNTDFTASIDGIALTSSNMNIDCTSHWQSTFNLYYYDWILTLTGISSLVDPDASTSRLTITTRRPSSSQTSTANLTIRWADFRPDAPTAPTFIYNDANYPGQAVLTGVDNTMEYRLQSEFTSWNSISGDSVVFDIPAADTDYYVHYGSPESKAKKLTLKASPAAPAISLDAATEQLTDLNTTMEMKVDDGSYFPVTSSIIESGAAPYINALDEGETATLHIRTRASEESPQGQEQTLTLYPRTAAPSGLSYNPVTATVSGVSIAMQYRLEGGSWASVTGTTQNMEALLSATSDVNVEFRYKAVTGVSSASTSTTLTLDQLPTAPSLSLDLRREYVTGFDTQKTYQYNTTGSTTTWTSATLNNGEFSLSGIINQNNAVALYIREAKTSSTPASAPILLNVPKLQAAPTTAAFVYNDSNHPNQAVLTGLTTDMEYRRSVDSTWTLYTGTDIAINVPSSNTTYYVRKIAQDTLPNSAFQSITLLARGTAPSVTYDSAYETVGTLTAAMEVSTDGVNFTAITATTQKYSVSGIIDATTSGTTTFYVRTKAYSSTPASLNKTFTLYPRSTAPTGFTYNPVTCVVSGVSTAMQYTTPGANWVYITSSTLNVEQYLSGTSTSVILIRRSATSTSSASNPTEVTLNQLAVGPSLASDLTREVVTGFVSGKSYQYNITGSKTSWSNVSLSNNEFVITNFISSSSNVNLYIREAKTSTVPATAPTIVSIPMRPAAPSTPVFVYNNPSYPSQAVLTGLTTSMEYKLSTSSSWIACTGEDSIFDIPSSTLTYNVRTKSSTTTPTSVVKNLSLYARTSIYAPSVTLNMSTETIGTLNTQMEVSTDGINFTPITQTTSSYSLSSVIDATTSGTTTFYVRIKATATEPYSNSLAFTLYPRASQPVGLSYDAENKLITGVNNTMEYRAVGLTSWSSVGTSSVISVSNYLTLGYTQVQVRYKAVSNVSSASLPVTIDIY